MELKYDPKKFFLKAYNYDMWFENEESTYTTRKSDKEESVELSHRPPLEGDEKVKEGKGLKILTPNKLLTRLPKFLANKSDKYYIFCISIIKSPKNITKISWFWLG